MHRRPSLLQVLTRKIRSQGSTTILSRPSWTAAAHAPEPFNPPLPPAEQQQVVMQSLLQTLVASQRLGLVSRPPKAPAVSVETENEQPEAKPRARQSIREYQHAKFASVVESHNTRAAFALYRKLEGPVDPAATRSLVGQLLRNDRPEAAFHVLRQLDEEERPKSFYKTISSKLHMCPSVAVHRAVLREVQRRDIEDAMVPLLTSFVELGSDLARPLWEYLDQHKKLNKHDYASILKTCKYTTRESLPFGEILARMPDRQPREVLSVLSCMYPFSDLEQVTPLLLLLVEAGFKGMDPALTDALAASADYSTMLTLWELQHEPTEAMCEALILALANDPESYKPALSILVEMELRHGFKPSRALVRGLSIAWRDSEHKLDMVEDCLEELATQNTVTVSAVNAILSATAERGNRKRSAYLRQRWFSGILEPDVDTICYCMEVLGKHWYRRLNRSTAAVQRTLEDADDLLQYMDERGIAPSHHVIREYVELLCQLEQYDLAQQVLDRMPSELIHNKTLHRVAMTYVDRGEYDKALEVTRRAVPPMPFLVERIERTRYYEDTRHQLATRYNDQTPTFEDFVEHEGGTEILYVDNGGVEEEEV